MKIVHFQRAKGLGISIERLFQHIRLALPNDIIIEVKHLPHGGTNPFHLLKNCWFAFRNQGDINHITGDCHYIALVMSPKKTILTIHDCGHINSLTGAKKWLYKVIWFALPGMWLHYITAISQFTKDQLIKSIGPAYKDTRVIVNCVDPAFHRAHTIGESSFENGIVLQIGTKKNKNIMRIADALRGLDIHLRIIGELSEKQKKHLAFNKINYSNIHNIPDEKLLEEYLNASIVLFASTYEGFGLPVIESQAIGRVIITSDLSPMKDIAGNAAILVNPFDAQSIRSAIITVLNSPTLQSELIAKGIINAKRFSHLSVAREYLDLYHEIHNQCQMRNK